MCRGDGVAHRQDQPVSGGVQDQAHLVGQRAATAGAVGGELGLVQFDQVFGLAPGAVEGLIDVLGRTGVNAGGDEANVEALGGGLNAGTDTVRTLLRLGRVHHRSAISAASARRHDSLLHGCR